MMNGEESSVDDPVGVDVEERSGRELQAGQRPLSSDSAPATARDKKAIQALMFDRNRMLRINLPKPKSASTSTVDAMTRYQRLVLDGSVTDFVICIGCDAIIQYCVAKGTSGIIKHSQSCLKNKSGKDLDKEKQTTIPFSLKRKLPLSVSTS